jgi:RNA polymerase sigma-70 factor, ECF subfamily
MTLLMNETADAHILLMLKDQATKDKGFLQLMEIYKEPIYWHIRRLVVLHEDAEDILQETFIQAYRFAGSFKGESKIYTWLYRIATNECISHFRKNTKRVRNSGSIEKMSGELSETDSENSDAILVKFQQAILQLPEKQRIVFNLRYYDELSYEEIGQILNSSVNSLKTNYHYASEKIKQYLIDHA